MDKTQMTDKRLKVDNIEKICRILNGKLVAEHIKAGINYEVGILAKKEITPTLAIIRIGERPDDIAYENAIIRFCGEVGVAVIPRTFLPNIKMIDFVKELEVLNKNEKINGIMIFKPLPEQLDESLLKQIITHKKDIDCISTTNMAKLFEGDNTGLLPCTPAAVLEIIKYYNIDIEGKHIAVLGRSMVVGKPLSMMLLKENATVTICHSKTRNKEDIISKADIVISAIGKSKFVDKHFIKTGAIVIDVGINVDEDGNITGDVDYDEVIDKVEAITPVPEGVGSVTTSVLIKNLITATKKQTGQ